MGVRGPLSGSPAIFRARVPRRYRRTGHQNQEDGSVPGEASLPAGLFAHEVTFCRLRQRAGRLRDGAVGRRR